MLVYCDFPTSIFGANMLTIALRLIIKIVNDASGPALQAKNIMVANNTLGHRSATSS